MPVELRSILADQRQGKRRARRKNSRTIPPVTPRRTDELWFRRELEQVVRETSREIEEALAAVLAEIDATTTDALVLDRDPSRKAPKLVPRKRTVRVGEAQKRRLAAALSAIEGRLAVQERLAEVLALKLVNRVDESHKRRFFERLKAATSVDLEKIVGGEGLGPVVVQSVEANVALIKSIPSEQLSRVRELVEGAVIRGESPDGGMRRELQRIGGITRRRAQFIARDQTAKLNGQLTQARNQAVGIVEYVWRTSGDSRVRPSHAEKNGHRFRWDTPPPDTGHPGQDFQCRCTARSVIPD